LRSWAQFAERGHFHVAEVAAQLEISSRSLERYFKKQFHEWPHKLFAQWRAEFVREQAESGKLGKETFRPAGLSSCSSLTRALKHDTGAGLRKMQKRAQSECRKMSNRKG